MSVPVVPGPHLGLRKNLIRLGYFLKALFGCCITGVLVGMVLDGKAPVSLFQLLIGGITPAPKNFVIVSLAAQSFALPRSTLDSPPFRAARPTVDGKGVARQHRRGRGPNVQDKRTLVSGVSLGLQNSRTSWKLGLHDQEL